jgi:hypothetical protein
MAGIVIHRSLDCIAYPRPIRVQSQSFCLDGLCLCLVDGKAVVEDQQWAIRIYGLTDSIYMLKFLDRE